MRLEVQRALDALHQPLRGAAVDGFAGLADRATLGDILRGACDRVLKVAPHGELAQWRQALVEFEAMPVERRVVEVARGLRLVRTMARSLPAARPAEPPPSRRATGTTSPPAVSVALGLLAASPATLKGIGPAFAASLAERGIETIEDLLWLLPTRYDDARHPIPLTEALRGVVAGDRITFSAEVASARMIYARGRRWAEVRVVDGQLHLVVRWFNVFAGIEKRFPVGSKPVLSGIIRERGGRWEMANPDVIAVDGAAGEGRIVPRYPEIAGVPAARVRAACGLAADAVSSAVDDGVPARVIAEAALPSVTEALRVLHRPPPDLSTEDLAALNQRTSSWQRRLVWGELFVLGAAVAERRRQRRADQAVPCPATPSFQRDLAAALPFALTGAQRRAVAETTADLGRAVPMNRLLQGDVGSGKTAVAFAAALQVARAGRQVALMVPTEVLAEQHMATLSAWTRRAGLRVALLTASTPRGVRQSLLSLLGAGEIDLVIGTHALLAEGVGFARLGLVVVDEQHRFGVAQRIRLRSKSDEGAPHLLVMTATPIPRTLALTAYGDLDTTVLDELPPGRTPVVTKILRGARGRTDAYRKVRARAERGERVFVVCPLVEPGVERDDDRADAVGTHAALARELAPLRVGLVHGRIAAVERDATMAAFQRGDLDVLVATTVIEVGVDVPAATCLVIEDADGFGLAQLHQLRGRVGRGGQSSECFLLTSGSVTDAGRRRLEVMEETTDGFRIAEEDLALRGPGELLGAKQAGLPRLRFGDLRQHTELLLEARGYAEAVVVRDPGLTSKEHDGLRAALARRLRDAYGSEGG